MKNKRNTKQKRRESALKGWRTRRKMKTDKTEYFEKPRPDEDHIYTVELTSAVDLEKIVVVFNGRRRVFVNEKKNSK